MDDNEPVNSKKKNGKITRSGRGEYGNGYTDDGQVSLAVMKSNTFHSEEFAFSTYVLLMLSF